MHAQVCWSLQSGGQESPARDGSRIWSPSAPWHVLSVTAGRVGLPQERRRGEERQSWERVGQGRGRIEEKVHEEGKMLYALFTFALARMSM